jgi:hypothetical protein
MKCEKCGHEMTQEVDGVEQTCIGWQLRVDPECTEYERIMYIFGANEFNFCFTCLLKTLGAKLDYLRRAQNED